MRNLKLTHAPLAVAVPAVAAALLVGHSGAGPQAVAHGRTLSAPAPERVIASSTERGFRVDVVARETSGGNAPTATVYVTAYELSGSVWHRLDTMRLGPSRGFFWDSVTGPHAVRDFTLSNSYPRGGSVRLLVTPALGWSPAYHFQLRDWHFVR